MPKTLVRETEDFKVFKYNADTGDLLRVTINSLNDTVILSLDYFDPEGLSVCDLTAIASLTLTDQEIVINCLKSIYSELIGNKIILLSPPKLLPFLQMENEEFATDKNKPGFCIKPNVYSDLSFPFLMQVSNQTLFSSFNNYVNESKTKKKLQQLEGYRVTSDKSFLLSITHDLSTLFTENALFAGAEDKVGDTFYEAWPAARKFYSSAAITNTLNNEHVMAFATICQNTHRPVSFLLFYRSHNILYLTDVVTTKALRHSGLFTLTMQTALTQIRNVEFSKLFLIPILETEKMYPRILGSEKISDSVARSTALTVGDNKIALFRMTNGGPITKEYGNRLATENTVPFSQSPVTFLAASPNKGRVGDLTSNICPRCSLT